MTLFQKYAIKKNNHNFNKKSIQGTLTSKPRQKQERNPIKQEPTKCYT